MPQNKPDPAYPDGKRVDIGTGTGPKVSIDMPYPFPCIGKVLIACATCNQRILITVAGRPDDPRAVSFNCKANEVRYDA